MNASSQSPYTRRQLLQRAGSGFGMLGLAGTLASQNLLAADAASPLGTPLGLHHSPTAKRVIFLFMNGAPSHVDTFDPKPALKKYAGQQPTGKLYRKSKGSGFMPSPFRFTPSGESGVEVSELFPHLARHIDEICVLRSMHTDVPNHEPGLMMMHAGNQQPIRPSLGSWLSYGLGSENENLPGFIALCPGRPVVGPQLWSSGFLPGEHQGTAIDTKNMQVERLVANIKNPHLGRPEQRRQIDLLQQLNRLHSAQRDEDAALDAQIRAMELAFAMQFEALQAFDINREPQHIRKAYGSSPFANSCLLARRLVAHGVRYVQVYYVTGGKQPWDTHKDNAGGLRKLCKDSDQPIAALLGDLKARGLLEDTLVVWGGEFGRTPYAEQKAGAKAGRDHHHTGFSMWMAGGGVRGGMVHGATDGFGMKAVEKRMHVHDLHATILHLMGIDHLRLTFLLFVAKTAFFRFL